MNGRFAREQAGATMVEFAIALPVLLLILLVCIDFGRAVNAQVTVANASREGARYVVAHPGATGAQVATYLATRVAPLNTSPSAFTVGVASTRSSDDRWVPGEAAPWDVVVTVTYRWSATTWLTSAFFAAASGSQTFSASSVTQVVR